MHKIGGLWFKNFQIIREIIDFNLCVQYIVFYLTNSGRRKTTLPCYWLDFDLKNLLFFSQNVSNHQDCSGLFTIVPSASAANGVSFARMLHKAKKMVGKVGNDDLVRVASAFRFSTICTSPEERVENFPCLHLLHSAKMLDLLRAKLSQCSANKSVALVQLMLFWFHQIQLSYRFHPLGELKQLSEICFLLLKYMVSELLFGKFDYEGPKRACVLEVVETICNSPALTLTLSHPSCCHEEPSPGSLNISFEEFCGLSEAGIHPMDNIVLLLETVAKNILVLSHGDNSVHETDEAANKRIVNVFKDIIKQVVLTFKCKLEICISTEDLIPLLPIFTIFKAFIYFMSPSMLLELVNWIFSKVEEKDLNDLESLRTFGFSLGCYVCEVALESLYANLNKQSPKAVAFDLYWEMEGRTNDISHLEKVCYKIIEIATSFKLENADLCLLKVVNIVNKQRIIQPRIAILPSCMALVKVILSSPIEMISHCINNTSATRAKLLFFLTQSSSLHLTLFGKILTSILNGDKKQTREICKCAPTDEELIILLPVTLLFLDMCFERFGLDFLKHFGSVLSSYSNILLDSFLNWRSFAAGNIFQEDAGEFLPSSTHELLKGFSESLLGKAVCMLQYHFTIDNDSAMIRTRGKLFDHICSYSNKNRGLLDFDMCEIKLCSPEDSLKLINRVIAKISFCWMLLFPKEDLLHSLHTVTEGQSRKLLQGLSVENERSAKMGFINLLVTTLHHIVQGFPLVADDSEKQKNADCSQIFRCLEIFILGIIMEFAKQMRDDLIQLSSIPFLENFVKTCFLFRFEDPTTLRVLRSVLNLLSEGKFRHNMFFEMLLEHSQFVPTIHSLDSSFASLALPIASTLLKPMSSILKSFDLFSAEISNDSDIIARDTCSLYMRKLELVRLLRTLYHLRVSSLSSEENTHVNSRELISLLFSCYGATMCEIDMEIFNLIRDIMSNEGSDCVSIADMDYLWGSSASKVRSEKTLDKALSSNDMADCETAEDRRRGQFRDYFAFDCKLCVATILNFPYDRTTSNDGIFLKKIPQENLIDKPEIPAGSCGIQRYDPAFLLHMSIHVLSNGYLEPLEFAGLGLLAVAFMSMSSPDKGMRKLGYEAIGRFKNSLETCQNRKDGLRLRLLLTCLQNGITEPWQRIPSVVAIFSAEASFVLLDPSNDHYATISKLLMHSQQVNMKSMPLFNTMFESTSVNFKKERLWILQLSYAGLNLDVDAHIFMKGGLLEILMSFYYSPVADYESKILILQGKALLLKSVTWGICTASRPYARDQVFQIPTGSYYTSVSEEDQSQDSLISKLLRWVTASVILEKVLESFKTYAMESSQSHHQNQTISTNDVQSSVDNLLQRWKRRQRWQNFLHHSWQNRLQEHAKKSAPWRIHLANFLESTPLHILTIFLLLVDLAFTIFDLSSSLISCRSKNERETTVSRVFHYAGIAILAVLLAKVLGLVVALGCAFFARPGRVVDAVVVIVALVLELMLKKEGAGLIVVVSLWRVVRVVESAFEVSDEAIEAKIEKIVSQFEVLSSENQLLRESIVEKDKLILELEAALDQAGCGAGKCNIEIVGQPL